MRERERERERENLGQWFVATKSGFREREREREKILRIGKKKNLYFGKNKEELEQSEFRFDMGLVWFNFGHKGWCFGLLRVLLGLYESLMNFYSSLSELGFDVGIQPPNKNTKPDNKIYHFLSHHLCHPTLICKFFFFFFEKKEKKKMF